MDDRDQYPRRPMWVPWAMTSLALVVVALLAFSVGARHEVVVNDDSFRHGWIGFPFFTFFILFWVFCGFRRMWWGGAYYYRPWRYRRRYYDHPDDDREFEEWHRREHERMDRQRSGSAPPDRQ